MKSKRSKATDISSTVRKEVIKRDSPRDVPQCIFCGSLYSITIAHYVSRASGGLGIEQNLACVCFVCHSKLDQSVYRKSMLVQFERYLKRLYQDWDVNKLKYVKGETNEV